MDDAETAYRIAIASTLAQIQTSLANISVRMDEKFNVLTNQFDRELDRVTDLETRLNTMDNRLSVHTSQIKQQAAYLAALVSGTILIGKELFLSFFGHK